MTLQIANLLPDNEMGLVQLTIQRRRDFVVAGAISLKVAFFLAYRGRHPQSVEAILGGFQSLSITMGLLLISSVIIDNEMRFLTRPSSAGASSW